MRGASSSLRPQARREGAGTLGNQWRALVLLRAWWRMAGLNLENSNCEWKLNK